MRVLQIGACAAAAMSVGLMLKAEGFNVHTTDLGEEGGDLARRYDYDLVLLDLNLPDTHGLAVLRGLRAARITTPVLVLTGEGGVGAKVAALDAGADDYMTKPFHRDELAARARAVIRRSRGHAQSLLAVGPVSLDLGTRRVRVGEARGSLTGKEHQLLELLMLRAGQTVSKQAVMDHLYGGMDEPEMKIVDVFVCKLRKKLDALAPDAGAHVETIWGTGYRMVAEPAPRLDRDAAAALARQAQLAGAEPSIVSRALDLVVQARPNGIRYAQIRAAIPRAGDGALRKALSQLAARGLIHNESGPPPRPALYVPSARAVELRA